MKKEDVCEEFSNSATYFGSLSPEKSKSVNEALSELAKMVREKKDNTPCSCGDKYKCGCGIKRHNQALEDLANEIEGRE